MVDRPMYGDRVEVWCKDGEWIPGKVFHRAVGEGGHYKVKTDHGTHFDQVPPENIRKL